MTASTVAEVAGMYFEAWKAGDFARVHSILADDVTFDGPLGHASNADECVAGLRRMSQIVTDIVIRKTFIDVRAVNEGLSDHNVRHDLRHSPEPRDAFACVAGMAERPVEGHIIGQDRVHTREVAGLPRLEVHARHLSNAAGCHGLVPFSSSF